MDDNSFYSIDRLVEFGLGSAVARQMVQSMNLALQNTFIPGPQNAATGFAGQIPPQYFVILDDKQAGPFSAPELSTLMAQGKLTKDTYVWSAGMPDWQKAADVPDVLRLVALAPPPFKRPETP